MIWLVNIFLAIIQIVSVIALGIFMLAGWTAVTTKGNERIVDALWALGAGAVVVISFLVLAEFEIAPIEILGPIVLTLCSVAAFAAMLGVFGAFADRGPARFGSIYLALSAVGVFVVCLVALNFMGYTYY
ncbi:hypothetical protein OAD24_06040 [Pseudomonadales bacterium]|nr:hypothetical protein [Pseudomonadales bacterium]